MAPGRKRGANRAKTKNKLSLGDLVLAKVKGFPAWPAKISRPEDWERTPDPKKYFVQFFGTAEIAFVAPADIQEFTNEAKNKLSARCQGKTVKDFARAVKEICEAFEEVQAKNTGEEKEKTELADIDSSVDGGEDESKEKLGMIGVKGLGNQALGDEMCGLERCSHRQDETADQDIKAGILCDAEHLSPVISVSVRDSCKDAAESGKERSIAKSDRSSPPKEGVGGDEGKGSEEVYTELDKQLSKKNTELEKPESLLKSLNAARSNVLTENERNSPSCLVGDEKSDSQLEDMSIPSEQLGELKFVGNGQKSRKVVSLAEKKEEPPLEMPNNTLPSPMPVKHDESGGGHDLPSTVDHLKNGEEKNLPYDSLKESSSGISKLASGAGNRKKAKSSVKSEKHFKAGVDQKPTKNFSDRTEEQGKSGPPVGGDNRHKKGQTRDRKHILGIDEDSRPGKRPKIESVGTAATKKSISRKGKNDSLCSDTVAVNKIDNDVEGKQLSSHLEVENLLASRLIGLNEETNLSGDDGVLLQMKHETLDTVVVKKSNLKTWKNDSLCSGAAIDDKVEKKAECQKLSSNLKGEDRSASDLVNCRAETDLSADVAVLPQAKRRRQALEASSDSAAGADKNMKEKGFDFRQKEPVGTDHGRSLINHVQARRRAVRRVDDDDDDGCTTPVHGGSQSTCKLAVSNHSQKNDVVHTVGNPDLAPRCPSKDGISHVKNESISPSPNQSEQKRLKKTLVVPVSQSPTTVVESRKLILEEEMPSTDLPQSSQGLVTGIKSVERKNTNSQLRASGNAQLKKTLSGPAKVSGTIPHGTMHSHSQVGGQKNGPTVSMEKTKRTPKSTSRTSGASATEECFTDNDKTLMERLEAGTDDKVSGSSLDTKFADSVTSMKHLIAAAQAKRKEAHSQSLALENRTAFIPAVPVVPGSLSPDSANLSFPFNTSIAIQNEMKAINTQASPPVHGHQFKPQLVDKDEHEEGRISSGYQAPRGSLSGGTEAAVARDAFEGMIETLSRTKESIGRATRLAIDCAKYGIAGEVVELLIRKLESEPSFHRRVDLFFLVDSITQCSHSQKGIAGASYIPTVQAALPRLLGAAAPPGAGARENRRQCLKVLRLWLERKILPESVLRRYMDDIGGSNDDMSGGFFLRRPSRAERAIDDPIREMEGMLVDEYGSNATFQLPGLLSSRVLDDEEDISGDLCNVSGDESEVETMHAPEVQEACPVTPVDRRHRILEDVDGELEMEDVSGSMKDEKPIDDNSTFKLDLLRQSPNRLWESRSCNHSELPPLPLGSPPLPFGSPPPLPPLPSSPPPPPPPSSPSPPPPPPPLPPPPPPPPPSQPLPPLIPAPGSLPSIAPPLSLIPQPSLPPQSLMPSHQGVPHQPLLPQSSTAMGYQPPIHQEYSRAPSGNQVLQMTGNAPHPGHVNAPVVNNEMYLAPSSSLVPAGMSSTHDASGFTLSRPSEFGHNEMYVPPHNSQPSQQFQAGNMSFAQRPYHQVPPAQTSTSYLTYNKPTAQHHMQQQFPQSYSLPSFPNGQRQYVADEQWKMPSSDINSDNQHTGWLGGGRTACSRPPFPQEGYFRQPIERPPASTLGFQVPVQNSLASGAPLPAPGHGGGHMLPCTQDISARNSWRPT